jgi:hypothetical protein
MGRSVVRVYENIASEANGTTLRLEGRGPGGANRAAIGAQVRVTTGSVTQRRDVQGNWGLAGLGTEGIGEPTRHPRWHGSAPVTGTPIIRRTPARKHWQELLGRRLGSAPRCCPRGSAAPTRSA